jgi:hypothetical protein
MPRSKTTPPVNAMFRRTATRAILGAARSAPLLARRSAAGAEAAGYVQEAKGQVTAELASHRRVLVPHSDLFLGDDLATAEQSRAALQLGQDTSVRLGANARLRIDRFIVNAGGVLTLEAGPLLLDKTPSGSPTTLQVRGAFGLIMVRGTRIFVGPSNGVIGIFVVHGLIDVTAGGQSIVLQDGEGTNIASPGAAPTAPVLWGQARIRAALASVE